MKLIERRFLAGLSVVALLVVLLGWAGRAVSMAADGSHDRQIDQVFAKWTTATPGCAVGVATSGTPVASKAYGMADLEHDVRISPDTIFEAGSVSKQFTAAAVLLLTRDGRVSLDDPVKKYIPELPDYGSALTVRQMLTHTSGLRDWGSVAGVAGWPRGSRAYTHAHVLEIVARQKALNFEPGTRWSYSNTGFNLAAILVSRVSGTSFAEFTRTRLFEPSGMHQTSWRDDYTRIVKGRAIAYAEEPDGFHTDMPFEDVYGNGGLLTTVGDLLKWNEHYASPKAADRSLVEEQQQRGTFTDGRPFGYALGLFVGSYQGAREIYHSGSTAGYSAFITRFPDQQLSVAVLCNSATAQPTQYAHAVAEIYLAGRLNPPAAPVARYAPNGSELEAIAGMYRNRRSDLAVRLVHDGKELREEDSAAVLVAQSPTRFVTATDQTWEFDAHHSARVTDEYGTVDVSDQVATATPSSGELEALAGTYDSDEAEVTLVATIEKGMLVLKRRPDSTIALTPLYTDAFKAARLGTIVFRRDGAGRPSGLSVIQDRVWDLRFTRRSSS